MNRTRQLTGSAKTRYLRALLDDGDAAALVARADAEITGIIVTRAAAERPRRLRSVRQGPKSADDTSRALSAPSSDSVRQPLPAAAAAAIAAPAAAATSVPFDPYGFSAMAVLLSEGRAALEARLEAATTREQIAQLAAAQSVRLEPKLLGNPKTGIARLRSAFIEAVEKRVAHRRAVAS